MSDPHSPMRLNVGFIVAQSAGFNRDFTFDLPQINIPPDLQISHLVGSIRATRTPQGILLQAALNAQTSLECVRCLTIFQQSLRVDFTELYAFEPSFYNRKGFYANINLNGIENINVMFNAIGGSDEDIDFLERGSVSCVKPMTDEYSISDDTIKATNKVKMVTLGTVFPQGIDIPVIMKIDTEGVELGVLRGGENLFLGTQMILLIEHHDSKISGNKDKIINYLKKLNYTINYEDKSKLVATNMVEYKGLRV